MLESGYRISDLNNIPVTGAECTHKNKIALDETYMLGYAHTVYGIKYNRNNYKIPLKSIREDIRGYIGIESLTAPWSEQMKFWHGLWQDTTSKNRSYVYEWKETETNDPHYMPEKFADLENSYYIIRNAPFPYETEDCNNRGERGEITPVLNAEGENIISTNKKLEAADPHPDSNKLVLKSYVDERLASKRLIDVKTEFWVRDYDCNYVIRAEDLIAGAETVGTDEPLIIKIHYPDKFEERVKNNNLEFTLMVEGVETEEGSGIYKPAITNLAKWELYDSEGKQLNICWLNKTDEDVIVIPNLHEPRLYDNARYMIFSFRTITDKVENYDKVEIVDGKEEKTGEYTKASYMVYAACENMLYRNRSVITVNDEIVQHLYLTSSDNSININSTSNAGSLNVDLTVNQELPTYDIVSSDNSIIINTTEDGKHTTFDVSVPEPEKQKEIEILSSSSVKVKEVHTDNTKFYQLESTYPGIVAMDPGIIIEDTNGTWEVSSNFTIEGGDNVNVEEIEIDTDDVKKKGWKISATIPPCEYEELTIEAGDNIIVEKLDAEDENKGWKVSAEVPPTKVILKDLPEIIDFAVVRNEVYKISGSPTINTLTDNLIENETAVTKVYFDSRNNAEDVYINGEINWVMTKDGTSPAFKPNRLYCISLTALPDFILNEGYRILGRIEWFQNL